MAYEAWERDHDTNLVKSLRSAKIVEEKYDGDILISLAHLSGRISFSDGVMYWSVNAASDVGGAVPVDQKNIDASAEYLTNYARKAIRANLERIANRVIGDASKRLERAQ